MSDVSIKLDYLRAYREELQEPMDRVLARKAFFTGKVPVMIFEEMVSFDGDIFDELFDFYVSTGRKPSRRPILARIYPWFGYIKGNVYWAKAVDVERQALRKNQMKDLHYSEDNVHFVSDVHFLHKNILRHNREHIADIDTMHQLIIDEWNKQVKPNDLVFDLGDLTLGSMTKGLKLLEQLNGFIIHLKGNHVSEKEWEYYDVNLPKQKFVDSSYFCTTLNGQKIAMCHFPILSWDDMHKDSWHLFGHCHGSNAMEQHMGKAMDVGVDATVAITKSLRPVSMKEVRIAMANKRIVSWDHHEVGGN